MSNSLNRGKFIKMTSVAGLGLGSWANASIITSRLLEKKINVAIMGVNNRGQVHAREFAKLSDVEVIHICDVDENVIRKDFKVVKEGGQNREPKAVTDFRILKDNSVDAISMALPIHWHDYEEPVPPAQVQQIRDMTQERAELWTDKELESILE